MMLPCTTLSVFVLTLERLCRNPEVGEKVESENLPANERIYRSVCVFKGPYKAMIGETHKRVSYLLIKIRQN